MAYAIKISHTQCNAKLNTVQNKRFLERARAHKINSGPRSHPEKLEKVEKLETAFSSFSRLLDLSQGLNLVSIFLQSLGDSQYFSRGGEENLFSFGVSEIFSRCDAIPWVIRMTCQEVVRPEQIFTLSSPRIRPLEI